MCTRPAAKGRLRPTRSRSECCAWPAASKPILGAAPCPCARSMCYRLRGVRALTRVIVRSKWQASLTRWESEPSIAALTAHANDGMIAQITEQFAHLHDLDSGAVPVPATLPDLHGEARPLQLSRFAPSARGAHQARGARAGRSWSLHAWPFLACVHGGGCVCVDPAASCHTLSNLERQHIVPRECEMAALTSLTPPRPLFDTARSCLRLHCGQRGNRRPLHLHEPAPHRRLRS